MTTLYLYSSDSNNIIQHWLEAIYLDNKYDINADYYYQHINHMLNEFKGVRRQYTLAMREQSVY